MNPKDIMEYGPPALIIASGLLLLLMTVLYWPLIAFERRLGFHSCDRPRYRLFCIASGVFGIVAGIVFMFLRP
jgi:hypothetical protein